LAEWFDSEEFRGCAFLHCVGELGGALPEVMAAAQQHKAATADCIAQWLPPHMRQQLQGFYDNDVLNRVRFKIGDRGSLYLANLSISYSSACAVALVDVVVFNTEQDANDVALWAHELKHIQQFRDWGVRDFSIRYLRSWNRVEADAHAAENAFVSWRTRMAQSHPAQLPGTGPAPACAHFTVVDAYSNSSVRMCVMERYGLFRTKLARLRIEVTGELAAVIARINGRPCKAVGTFLIQDENGQPLRTAAMRSRFDKARTTANVDFQFRDLRAKAATDTGDLSHAQSFLRTRTGR
jgi:hypothetical protein